MRSELGRHAGRTVVHLTDGAVLLQLVHVSCRPPENAEREVKPSRKREAQMMPSVAVVLQAPARLWWVVGFWSRRAESQLIAGY
jgi:hypothetical protein